VFTYQDEEGNEIEAVSVEELAKAKEQAEEAIKEREEKIETLEKQLEGEKDKEKNFANLRKKKQESDSVIEQLSEKVDSLADMLNQRNEHDAQQAEKTRDSILSEIAGEDKDLQEAIKLQYNKFEGSPISAAEIRERMEDSLAIVRRKTNTQGANPVAAAASASGNPSFTPKKDGESFADSSDGKMLGDSLGMTLENPSDNK